MQRMLEPPTPPFRDKRRTCASLPAPELDLASALLSFFILIQGYLFHPLWMHLLLATQLVHCIQRSINTIRQGWWIYRLIRTCEKLQGNFGHFASMRKPNWLLCQSEEKMDLKQLSELVTETTRPVLIARLDLEGKELDRGFVVPDNW